GVGHDFEGASLHFVVVLRGRAVEPGLGEAGPLVLLDDAVVDELLEVWGEFRVRNHSRSLLGCGVPERDGSANGEVGLTMRRARKSAVRLRRRSAGVGHIAVTSSAGGNVVG